MERERNLNAFKLRKILDAKNNGVRASDILFDFEKKKRKMISTLCISNVIRVIANYLGFIQRVVRLKFERYT